MSQHGIWSFSGARVGNTPSLVLEGSGGVLHSGLGGMRSNEPRMKHLAAPPTPRMKELVFPQTPYEGGGFGVMTKAPMFELHKTFPQLQSAGA